MKIAFLLTQLETGGAQVRVFETARELRSRGHRVDVMFLYKRRDCFEHEDKIILSDKGGARNLLMAAFAFRRRLRAEQYDAVVTNTAPANILGMLAAWSLGQKLRLAVQTQPPQKLNPVYRALDLILGCGPVYRFVIANSGWTRSCFDGYPSIYRKKMHLISNGVVQRLSDMSKEEARACLGLPQDAYILAAVGRLSYQKGHDTLIQAVAANPGVHLAIAGDGELKAELLRLVSELGVAQRVSFLGEISGDGVSALMKSADAFAFPSRWETFGLAVVEASGFGLPIIASDLAVTREVLSVDGDDPAAEFVPVDDVAGWTSAIRDLRTRTGLAESLSRQSLLVMERHSMSGHVDRLLALLNRMAPQPA